MIRFATVEEAQFIVENLNGNIPEGLAYSVEVQFTTSQHGNFGKASGKGLRPSPYAEPHRGGRPRGSTKGGVRCCRNCLRAACRCRPGESDMSYFVCGQVSQV